MTTRVLNRRARRVPVEPVDPPAAVEAAAPTKPAAKPRVRKRTVKAPPRLFARWAVCDSALKRVAVFEYRDRVTADAKLADLLGRKPGGYVMQMVKEARPADEFPAA